MRLHAPLSSGIGGGIYQTVGTSGMLWHQFEESGIQKKTYFTASLTQRMEIMHLTMLLILPSLHPPKKKTQPETTSCFITVQE